MIPLPVLAFIFGFVQSVYIIPALLRYPGLVQFGLPFATGKQELHNVPIDYLDCHRFEQSLPLILYEFLLPYVQKTQIR